MTHTNLAPARAQSLQQFVNFVGLPRGFAYFAHDDVAVDAPVDVDVAAFDTDEAMLCEHAQSIVCETTRLLANFNFQICP